jgi:nucleoid-associated protein YgaU
MGIFESIKSAFSKAEPDTEEPLPPREETAAEELETPEPPTGQAAEQGATGSYTVQPGDTLWRVAERVYGNGANYQAIFEANTELLESPDQIFPGQTLVIPQL